MVAQCKTSEYVSGNIEVTENVGFAQSDLPVRTQHAAKRPGMLDVPCEPAKLPRLRVPARAVPKLDRKVARAIILEQRFKDVIGTQGQIARLGGDEFAVISPASDRQEASAATAGGLSTCIVPFTIPGGKPVTLFPGLTPRFPVTIV